MKIAKHQIVMRRPDDFHLHVRQGALLTAVVPETARVFSRALIMPNTIPPVAAAEDVEQYREQIIDAAGSHGFEPLMAFKISSRSAETWNVEKLRHAAGLVAGKYYPQGATTNAEDGIRNARELYPLFDMMQSAGTVLAIHGEDPEAFCLDREAQFLPLLSRIAADFPRLRIVLEHVSSRAGIDAVNALPKRIAATITVHHLLLTLDDLVGGLLSPHNFCKPIVKTPADRDALREVVFSGNPRFFFGSDSAPHPREAKESASGSAGVFSAPVALPALVELFMKADRIERLEDFIAGFGADFYELPRNAGEVTLISDEWRVPAEIAGVVPFLSGTGLRWAVE
ncbi:MAG TPA: dihydroorotase [Spirochaetia bacterium]|nr:dihydroorotase [Spirochaetia bacterium]